MAQIDKRYLDYRVTERYLNKGALKKSEYEAQLKSLPDSETNAEWVQMDLHDTMSEEGSMEIMDNVSSEVEEETGTETETETETDSSEDT